jgi:hypothetical protein
MSMSDALTAMATCRTRADDAKTSTSTEDRWAEEEAQGLSFPRSLAPGFTVGSSPGSHHRGAVVAAIGVVLGGACALLLGGVCLARMLPSWRGAADRAIRALVAGADGGRLGPFFAWCSVVLAQSSALVRCPSSIVLLVTFCADSLTSAAVTLLIRSSYVNTHDAVPGDADATGVQETAPPTPFYMDVLLVAFAGAVVVVVVVSSLLIVRSVVSDPSRSHFGDGGRVSGGRVVIQYDRNACIVPRILADRMTKRGVGALEFTLLGRGEWATTGSASIPIAASSGEKSEAAGARSTQQPMATDDESITAWPMRAERVRMLVGAMRDWPGLTAGGGPAPAGVASVASPRPATAFRDFATAAAGADDGERAMEMLYAAPPDQNSNLLIVSNEKLCAPKVALPKALVPRPSQDAPQSDARQPRGVAGPVHVHSLDAAALPLLYASDSKPPVPAAWSTNAPLSSSFGSLSLATLPLAPMGSGANIASFSLSFSGMPSPAGVEPDVARGFGVPVESCDIPPKQVLAASFKTSLLVQLFTRPCYSLVPSLTATLVTSVLRSLGDGAACDVRLWVLCAVQLAYAACVARMRPSRVGFSNVLSAAMGFVTALGFALLGLEVSAGLTTTAASEVCTLVLSAIGGIASVRSVCAFTLRFCVGLHDAIRARRQALRRQRGETVAFYAGRFLGTTADADLENAAAIVDQPLPASSPMVQDDTDEMDMLAVPRPAALPAVPAHRFVHVTLDGELGMGVPDNESVGSDPLLLLSADIFNSQIVGTTDTTVAATPLRFAHHELDADEGAPPSSASCGPGDLDSTDDLPRGIPPSTYPQSASLDAHAADFMMNARGDVASLRFQRYEYEDDTGAADAGDDSHPLHLLLDGAAWHAPTCYVNPLGLDATVAAEGTDNHEAALDDWLGSGADILNLPTAANPDEAGLSTEDLAML